MAAMFAPPSQVHLVIRRLACLVLVLWLAGVGCIIGCEMNTASAATTPTTAPREEAQTATEDESCDASAGHDCCQKKDGDSRRHLGSSQNGTHSSCCPLAALSADPARQISAKDAPLSAAGSVLPVAARSRLPTQVSSYRLRVPDRGSTHLRLCVFLI